MLPIAPATYYDHLAKRADPTRLPNLAKRDETLRPQIQRIRDANWQVYGARKVWRQLRREGFDVARFTVAGLMKAMDIQGIIRGRPHKTTIPDKKLPCPMDKVNRQFRVPAANMLWVSEFSVATQGAASKPSNTQPSNGSTGSTSAAGSNACASRTSRRQKPKETCTQLWKLEPWPRSHRQQACGKPGTVRSITNSGLSWMSIVGLSMLAAKS
ncbi:IS3 family transposase [bacterium]|nr:IS3 family transposase [bacterium]